MIHIDDIPNSGVLIVTVYFDGENKGSYQNDSRRRLETVLNKICEEKDLETEIIPYSFSLVRTISDGVSRATGAQYQYGYSNMDANDLKELYEGLIEKSFKWWEDIQIMIATEVEGLYEY
jgi:hypothetical protein